MIKKSHIILLASLVLCMAAKAQDTAKGINDPRAHYHHNLGLPIAPRFPGGKDSLAKYLAANVHYPTAAAKKHITGTVTVSFLIDTLGNISRIKVTKPLSTSCDKEAERVIKNMPKWTPEMNGRRPKAMDYYLDITFAPSDKK